MSTLATGTPYRKIAEEFNIGKGYFVKSFYHIIDLINQHHNDAIQWPTGIRNQRIQNGFNSYKFPNVVGAIKVLISGYKNHLNLM